MKKVRWIWEFYFYLLVFSIFKQTFAFFHPESPIYLYHFVLTAFSPFFSIAYTIDAAQILISILHLIALYGFIHQKQILSKIFWRYALFLRLVLDIAGHSYAYQILKSIYHTDLVFTLIVLVSKIAIHIPSYAACFEYAFGKNLKKT